MSVTTRFTAADDLLHDIGSAPHGRESLAWVAPLPDDGLALFAYAWRNAETKRWGRLVGVGCSDIHAPLVFDLVDGIEAEGDDLDDIRVGGLHIRQPEPLHVAELRFESDELQLDLRAAGMHRAFSWHENEGGCPDWAAADRYEQSMRTSGTVVLPGREPRQFTGVGHRDHSWGTRDWRALQHWKWMNAATPDGEVSVHAFESLAYADRGVYGYVNRGGEVVPIRDVAVETELDDRLIHRAVRAAILDEEGGETVVEATLAAGIQVPIAQLYMNEIAMRATIDGAPAAAHMEFGWLPAYVAQLEVDAG